MKADRPRWSSTPVFFSRTFCPICRVTHEWFAKEAWLCDSSEGTSAVRDRNSGWFGAMQAPPAGAASDALHMDLRSSARSSDRSASNRC
jgi:hypothetical protein